MYFVFEINQKCQVQVSMIDSPSSASMTWTLNFVEGSVCTTACPIGQKFTSDADCTCMDIETIPVQGTLFQAHEYQPNSVHQIELDVNQKITFRQFAVDGQFPLASHNFADIECMTSLSEHADDFYMQVSF